MSKAKAGRAKGTFNYNQPGESVGVRYDTFLQAVKIVESGLPVAAVSRLHKTSGLTMERIKQVARISEGSFARRKETGRLSPEESERLLRVSRVFERATALHEGDQAEARQWLETPIPALGDQRPLDLAQTEPGAREVEDLIGRIEHGVLS
jgi:putative toxin-antitoxin system antitoxin component (TIGR02293 family)